MANFLGLNITLAAPKIRLGGSNFVERSRLAAVASASTPVSAAKITPQLAELPFVKASQELPATPPKQAGRSGLSERNVQGDALSDWYLQLPDKIPPKQISSILRGALAGNLWQQSQLTRLMADTWPTFAKCQFELRAAVASAKYVVHPYCRPGQKPTQTAEDKADLVTRCLNECFQPDRFADEDGVNGMIFDLTDALLNGVSIIELLWDENAIDPDGNPETTVRASAWVNTRNIACKANGYIGVAYASESGFMSFSNQVRGEIQADPDKFIVAKFKSKSGSPLGAGWMRKLAWYWVMIVYGRDFALNFAQKYGNPFFDVAYDSGITDQKEIDKFEELAKQAANQGYVVHPNNSEIKLGAAHSMGGENAQMAMMDLADQQCRELMLGQSLTTTVGDSGSRALGDVHNDVRTERIEEHAKWIARILTEQFADSVLRVNYGNSYRKNPERPTVEPDLTRPLSAGEQADYLQKVSNSTVPVMADETYKRAGLQQPSPGDKVLVRGELVILEDAATPTENRQKQFDEQLDQQLQVNSAMGDQAQPMAIEAALATASESDWFELESLVTAAERASHPNGELKLVKSKLNQILNKKRL